MIHKTFDIGFNTKQNLKVLLVKQTQFESPATSLALQLKIF